jgi:hypothetical protein
MGSLALDNVKRILGEAKANVKLFLFGVVTRFENLS